MRGKYVAYFLLLCALSVMVFLHMELKELETRLKKEELKLNRIKGELMGKSEKLATLKTEVAKHNLPLLGEERALRVLLSYIDNLKVNYEVKIIKDPQKVSDVWEVYIKLSFEANSGRELARNLRYITGGVSPVVEIKTLTIDTDLGNVELDLYIRQPFLERRV